MCQKRDFCKIELSISVLTSKIIKLDFWNVYENLITLLKKLNKICKKNWLLSVLWKYIYFYLIAFLILHLNIWKLNTT